MDITNPESVGFSTGRLARINTAMQRYLDRDQLAGMLTLLLSSIPYSNRPANTFPPFYTSYHFRHLYW